MNELARLFDFHVAMSGPAKTIIPWKIDAISNDHHQRHTLLATATSSNRYRRRTGWKLRGRIGLSAIAGLTFRQQAGLTANAASD
jgi:hypothetical protein